jgi:bacteriocin-like protein
MDETTTVSTPVEVSDDELENIVGGAVCCGCSDNACRL